MVIPLEALPNQSLSIKLGNQDCRFEFVTRLKNLFMNLYVNNELLIGGMICLNKVNLVQENYLGFEGQLYFEDLEGNEDPYFWGLNKRWVLNYVQ